MDDDDDDIDSDDERFNADLPEEVLLFYFALRTNQLILLQVILLYKLSYKTILSFINLLRFILKIENLTLSINANEIFFLKSLLQKCFMLRLYLQYFLAIVCALIFRVLTTL